MPHGSRINFVVLGGNPRRLTRLTSIRTCPVEQPGSVRRTRRTVSGVVLALAVIAAIAALRPPNNILVPATSEGAKSFNEKIASLVQASQEESPQPVHITEAELTSELQRDLEAAPAEQGAVVLTGISIHLDGDEFVGVFNLSASGIKLVMTLHGTVALIDHRLQVLVSRAKFGSLPIPAPVFQRILVKKLEGAGAREQMRLPDLIKDVYIRDSELLLEPQPQANP